MKRLLLLLALFSLLLGCARQSNVSEPAQTPRNIIVMISDGCGHEHIRATSYYLTGEEDALAYHSFPVKLAMSTWSLDTGRWDSAWSDSSAASLLDDPTDSAASGTAMSTGVKTWNGCIGVDGWGRPLHTLTEKAYELNKATGLVTTVQFSNATPAAYGAHNISRKDYAGIASELTGDANLRVLMGCGNPATISHDSTNYVERDYRYVGGSELWNRVTSGAIMDDCDNDGEPDAWTFIQHKQSFVDLAEGDAPKRLLGVPYGYKTLQCYRRGDADVAPYVTPFDEDRPTLAEMSRAALNVLDDDPDGLFLMIEGGAVDWASHNNQLGRMIEENIDFHEAVLAVIEWIEANGGWDENLLVITADHECGALWGPKTVLSGDTVQLQEVQNRGKGQQPDAKWFSKHHSCAPVPFFAKGAGSQEFVALADETDMRYGAMLDNTEFAQALHELWGGWEQPEPLDEPMANPMDKEE